MMSMKNTFNKWQEFLSEQAAQNFEEAVGVIKSLGYDYSVNKNIIKVLHDILTQRKNWVLSYNDSPEIRDLYKNYKIVDAEWDYGMKNVTTKEMGSSSELLIIG